MKNTWLGVGLLVLGLGAVGAYAKVGGDWFGMTESESMEKMETMSEDEAMMKDEEAMMEDEESMMEGDKMMEEERYIVFSPEGLEQAAERRRVLFFYANWCPTCKPADASFAKNVKQIPDDVVVIRVNYNDPETDDEEKALAKKYGVTYQHTFVQIDEEGNEVAKWNGGQMDELLSNLK